MIQSPIPNISAPSIALDLEQITADILLKQIDALIEKHFSSPKKLDTKQQSLSLQPYITEYKSYKGMHMPYTLEYLKVDRSRDLGTTIINLDLKVSKHSLYSFYLCWAEGVFEKGEICKQKYVYFSFDLKVEEPVSMFDVGSFLGRAYTKAMGKMKAVPKTKTKLAVWDYTTEHFSDFSKIFEQILEKHSNTD